jgi:hypothetical protein
MNDERRQPPTVLTQLRRAWPIGVALSCVAGLGCGPDPHSIPANDAVIETAHLRITTTTENPICAGTPLLLESELERIAAALDLPLWAEDDKLDVLFGEDAVEDVCSAIDLEDINGCVHYDDTEVIAAAVEISYTAPHELVHAVRRRKLPPGPPMFEEGLAGLLSGSEGFPVYLRYPHGEPTLGPLELLEIPRTEFADHYVASQSFVSWLWETQGRSTLMAFMNDPAFTDADAVLPLFEQHFGLPLAEAEQAWRNDPRPDPIWGTPCIPERTYSLADGPIDLSGDFDCREPTVYGASHFMSLWPMCLDVPENTRARLSFDADHGRFQVLSREPCDAGPAGAEAYRDKYLEAGDVLEEDIAGCRYRMLLFSQEPGFPPTPYTIRIEELES